jgi:hypothetical protein
VDVNCIFAGIGFLVGGLVLGVGCLVPMDVEKEDGVLLKVSVHSSFTGVEQWNGIGIVMLDSGNGCQ